MSWQMRATFCRKSLVSIVPINEKPCRMRVGSGGNLVDVLADGVELVTEVVEVALDLVGLGANEDGPREERLEAAPGGVVAGAEAGAAINLVVVRKSMLWAGDRRESYQVVRQWAKAVGKQWARWQRVRNMRRRLCVRDAGQKRFVALEVNRLAGVPTVLAGAA
jgi:hypothetical protein